MADHPFITMRELYGRPDSFFDCARFGRALCAELGGIPEHFEEGSYGRAAFMVDGVRLVIRGAQGAKLGRAEIFSGGGDLEQQIHYSWRPKFPTICVDASRPMDKLAKDIRRRLLEPAAEQLAKLRASVDKHNNERASLESAAAKLREALPTIDIQVPEDKTRTEAVFYFSNGKVYVSGRFYPDGRIDIDRVSRVNALPVLRALMAEG